MVTSGLFDLGGKRATRPAEGYPYNERSVKKSDFGFGVGKLSITRFKMGSISEENRAGVGF